MNKAVCAHKDCEHTFIKVTKRIYCSAKCAKSIQKLRDEAQRSKPASIKRKKNYDEAYRKENDTEIKRKKAEYFQNTYDPEKAAIHRQKRMPAHIEYCRQPAYKIKKKAYDKIKRAKDNAGEYWESYIMITEIENELALQTNFSEFHRVP